MSKPDKPIFNQQGGRGKLYGPTHGATYMGTYQMPDGKMDRRMFNCATNKDAIKAYTGERTEFKGLVKTGEISLADALADDRAKRIRVYEFLMCIPGIGKAKADDIMRKLGIAENRRVQGLGSRQREGIIELVAKLQ